MTDRSRMKGVSEQIVYKFIVGAVSTYGKAAGKGKSGYGQNCLRDWLYGKRNDTVSCRGLIR